MPRDRLFRGASWAAWGAGLAEGGLIGFREAGAAQAGRIVYPDTRDRGSTHPLKVRVYSWVPGYDRSWVRGDLIAGLTVWTVLVPEALAYASIAGVSPVVGLYAAPGALIFYAAFGRSRHPGSRSWARSRAGCRRSGGRTSRRTGTSMSRRSRWG